MNIILNKLNCGIKAREHEFPWVVSVRSKKDGNVIGGGCIIHRHFVLTAAHLFFDENGNRRDNPEDYYIAFGSISRSAKDNINYGLKRLIIHDDFNYTTTKNDICVLQLIENIDSVQPIKIRSAPVPEDKEVILPGWGIRRKWFIKYRSGNLTYLKLKYKTFEQGVYLRDKYFPKTKLPIDANNICTFTNNGQTVEHGDSGSPLIYNNELIGICSWGDESFKNCLTVFVNAEKYTQWIDDKIKECLENGTLNKLIYFQNKFTSFFLRLYEKIFGIN